MLAHVNPSEAREDKDECGGQHHVVKFDMGRIVRHGWWFPRTKA